MARNMRNNNNQPPRNNAPRRTMVNNSVRLPGGGRANSNSGKKMYVIAVWSFSGDDGLFTRCVVFSPVSLSPLVLWSQTLSTRSFVLLSTSRFVLETTTTITTTTEETIRITTRTTASLSERIRGRTWVPSSWIVRSTSTWEEYELLNLCDLYNVARSEPDWQIGQWIGWVYGKSMMVLRFSHGCRPMRRRFNN